MEEVITNVSIILLSLTVTFASTYVLERIIGFCACAFNNIELFKKVIK